MIEHRTARCHCVAYGFLHELPDKPIDLGRVARLDHDQTNSEAFIENLKNLH